MSIIINDNMEIRAPKPPDGRMVVDDIAQRNAIEAAYRWPGMLVYVKDTGDGTPQWQYLDVTNESQMGSNDNWKPVVSGVEPIPEMEGYDETGTRAGGDLAVKIGDYDDSSPWDIGKIEVDYEKVRLISPYGFRLLLGTDPDSFMEAAILHKGNSIWTGDAIGVGSLYNMPFIRSDNGDFFFTDSSGSQITFKTQNNGQSIDVLFPFDGGTMAFQDLFVLDPETNTFTPNDGNLDFGTGSAGQVWTRQSDGSVKFQNAPGLLDAPSDGAIYARRNGIWVPVDVDKSLSDVLGIGNETDGNDVLLSYGDSIRIKDFNGLSNSRIYATTNPDQFIISANNRLRLLAAEKAITEAAGVELISSVGITLNAANTVSINPGSGNIFLHGQTEAQGINALNITGRAYYGASDPGDESDLGRMSLHGRREWNQMMVNWVRTARVGFIVLPSKNTDDIPDSLAGIEWSFPDDGGFGNTDYPGRGRLILPADLSVDIDINVPNKSGTIALLDDIGAQLKALPDYDAGKTQTLTNVTDTLTWVEVGGGDAPDLTPYVKKDGSTPFTAPQEGVKAVNDNELTTLGQIGDILNPECAGGDWSSIASPEPNFWTSIATDGSGVWIAVSNDGTNRIMRSDDNGLTWSAIAAPEQGYWTSIATDESGVWIAVSGDGTNRIMRSDDNGLTWSAIAAPEQNTWESVATDGNGVWLAVSTNGTNRIMRSDDNGLTWSAIAAPEQNGWFSIATDGNGVWVAVAYTGQIMRSDDNGLTWSAIAAPEQNSWESVATDGSGVWIAVSQGGTNRIMRSDDNGLTWSAIAAPEQNSWKSVATDGSGVWIAVSYYGQIMRSDDNGLTWSAIAAPEENGWFSIATDGNGVWVAVSEDGLNQIMRLEEICPPKYVKDDGSTPFKSPQPGVSAVNSNDLTTLAQVESLIANSLLSMIWMGTSKDFDSVTNSGFQYSFGAGEATTSTFGLPIPYAAQVTNLYIRADSEPSLEANLELWINGVPSDAKITLGTTEITANVDVTSSNIMLQPGDFLNIKTLSGEGGKNSVVTIALRNIPA